MKRTTTRSLTDGVTVYEFTEDIRPNGRKVYTLSHWDSQDNLLNECRMSKTKLTHVWQSLKKLGFTTELVEPDNAVISKCILENDGTRYTFTVRLNSVFINKVLDTDGGITQVNEGWYTPEYARRCYKTLLKHGYTFHCNHKCNLCPHFGVYYSDENVTMPECSLGYDEAH